MDNCLEVILNVRSHIDDATAAPSTANCTQAYIDELGSADVCSSSRNAAIEGSQIDVTWPEVAANSNLVCLSDKVASHPTVLNGFMGCKVDRVTSVSEILRDADSRFLEFIHKVRPVTNNTYNNLSESLRSLGAVLSRNKSALDLAFSTEKAGLLSNQVACLDLGLARRRAREEGDYLDDRMKRYRECCSHRLHLLQSDNSAIQSTKLQLEYAIQSLELRLMQITASCQLNKEKLEYNLQVLVDRNKEHEVLKNRCRGRLNRLRTSKNALSISETRLSAGFTSENARLSSEFERFSRQYREMQERLLHAESVDGDTLANVWQMRQHETTSLGSKLLQADKRVYESTLGVLWQQPKEDPWLELDADGSQSGTGTMKTLTGTDSYASRSSRFPAAKLRKVFDLLVESATFLVGQSTHVLPAVAADHILSHIGVGCVEDLDLLVDLFFKGQDADDEELLSGPPEVIPLVAEFVKIKEDLRIADVSPQKVRKSSGEQVEVVARRRREENKFWERLGRVIPRWRSDRTYNLLLRASTTLLSSLQLRANCISHCQFLHNQNGSIRTILEKQLSSDVRKEPTVSFPIHKRSQLVKN